VHETPLVATIPGTAGDEMDDMVGIAASRG